MEDDGESDERIGGKMQFWFHYGGEWSCKDENLLYNVWDIDIMSDYVRLMTYDRILSHFSELGFCNPRGVYVFDSEKKTLQDGLYLIKDKESCRKVLQYLEVLNSKQIEIFVDHDFMRIPDFVSGILPYERMESERIEDYVFLNETVQKPDDEVIDVDDMIGLNASLNVDHEAYLNVGVMADSNVDDWVDSEHGEQDDWAEKVDEVRVESIYVNPLGYVSEEDDEEQENDEHVCEDNTGSDGEDDIDANVEIPTSEVDPGYFTLGMTFTDANEAREAINLYGVKFRYKLKFEKNEKSRLRVRCVNDIACPFHILVSKNGENGGLAVKTAYLEHNCFKQREVPSASQGFIAKYFKDTIYQNPKFRAKDMQIEILKHFKLHVSEYKCKRAKKMILHEFEGSCKQEFSNLSAYAEMVKKSNPESKCEIQLREEGTQNGQRIFGRMFVMMDACKRNWLGNCRPLISLDGCFLKSVTHGMLLTAVGKDAADQIVPIAWAVVSKETKVNWRWFMCWLRQELLLDDGAHITIMSDMQKGLVDAFHSTLPKAEHRWCATHIYANWSKKYPGDELEKKFRKCAYSTFEEDFKINLLKLGEVSKKAAGDLLRYPVHTWCRAYQSNRCCTYMVDNNISESFNSSLLEARHKPIISMLEDICVLAMTRIKNRKHLCNSWVGEWSRASMKMVHDAKESAVGCKVLWNGASSYEIGEGADKHTLLLDKKLCTCRVWELTSIPWCHAIAAMYYSKIEPLSMMSKWYHKSTYQKTYEFPILPVPGVKFLKTKDHAPIEPPPVEKMPGRPRKMRVRASNEKRPSTNKLSRRGQIQHCGICKDIGHKKNFCPTQSNQVIGNSQSSGTHLSKKMVPRRHLNVSKKTPGFGCHVNLSTGRTTINPGKPSERVINAGETPHISDPVVRGPIPNEKEINQVKRKFRHIGFSGEGSEVRRPTSLPFKPPGLQWNGAPSVTSRKLLEEYETRKKRKGQAWRYNYKLGLKLFMLMFWKNELPFFETD